MVLQSNRRQTCHFVQKTGSETSLLSVSRRQCDQFQCAPDMIWQAYQNQSRHDVERWFYVSHHATVQWANLKARTVFSTVSTACTAAPLVSETYACDSSGMISTFVSSRTSVEAARFESQIGFSPLHLNNSIGHQLWRMMPAKRREQ